MFRRSKVTKLKWLLVAVILLLLVLPLTVSAQEITVTDITPNTGSNTTADIHIYVSGDNFIAGNVVGLYLINDLESPTVSLPAFNLTVDSEELLECDIDLTNLGAFDIPAGIYYLSLDNGDESFIFPVEFTITSEAEPTPTETIPVCNNVTLLGINVEPNSTSWELSDGGYRWGVDYIWWNEEDCHANATYYRCLLPVTTVIPTLPIMPSTEVNLHPDLIGNYWWLGLIIIAVLYLLFKKS
jgi:hypothetical protein